MCTPTHPFFGRARGHSAVVVPCLAFLLMVACSVKAAETVTRAVNVVTVRHQESTRAIHISALLAYKSTRKLAFKVGGPVAEILVEEGAAVKKGQELARLDKEEVQARVQEAQARFDNAKRNVERLAQLFKDKMVSLNQLQEAQTARDVASSQLNVARFNLRYATIRAPQQGRIVRRMIEPSELVGPNQVAFVLADESQGWVMRTGLSDRKVAQIKLGDPVAIRFDPWPLKVFNGRVSAIAEAAEQRSGLFDVEIAVHPVAGMRLRDGYVGRITIQPGVTEPIVKLPTQALVSAMSPQGTVYVLNDDSTVSSRQVRIHYLVGSDVAVSGALNDGDQVITTGAAFVHEGDKVQVIHSTGQEGS